MILVMYKSLFLCNLCRKRYVDKVANYDITYCLTLTLLGTFLFRLVESAEEPLVTPSSSMTSNLFSTDWRRLYSGTSVNLLHMHSYL